MATLGTFGAAVREFDPDGREPDTFDFCGETFTVHGTIPGFVELQISAALAGRLSGVDGDAALYDALRTALTAPAREADGENVPADEAQWLRFQKLALEHRVESEVLTAIALKVMGAQVGRPTVQRSTSPSGPLPTSTSSNSSVSPSRDSPVFRRVDEVLGG